MDENLLLDEEPDGFWEMVIRNEAALGDLIRPRDQLLKEISDLIVGDKEPEIGK